MADFRIPDDIKKQVMEEEASSMGESLPSKSSNNTGEGNYQIPEDVKAIVSRGDDRSLVERQAVAPETERQVVSPKERFGLKNLISNSPELQELYLQRQGYRTKTDESGRVRVWDDVREEWGVVDPEGLDAQDVFDLTGDVIEMAATTASTVAGMAAGAPVGLPVPGAIAGGAAGGTLTETVRQAMAKELGFRDEMSGSEVATSGALSGIGAGVGSMIGKMLRPLFGGSREQAMARMLELTPARVKQVGAEGTKKAGKEYLGMRAAARGKTFQTFSPKDASPENILKATKAELGKIGKVIEQTYKGLDDTVPAQPRGRIVDILSKTGVRGKPIYSKSDQKFLQETIKDMIPTGKQNLKPSDLWKLASELEKKAGSFEKVALKGSPEVLDNAARQIRKGLEGVLRKNGQRNVIDMSRRYSSLRVVKQAMDDQITNPLATQNYGNVVNRVVGGLLKKMNQAGAQTPTGLPSGITGSGLKTGTGQSFLEVLEEAKKNEQEKQSVRRIK